MLRNKKYFGRESGSAVLATLLILGGVVVFGAWLSVRIFSDLSFNQKCEGYLKQAADANSPELALEKINLSIKYIEANNLISGSTAIVYPLPSEDIGFWYKNLKEAQKGLQEIKPDASPLEKSNQLMKLRETLLDKSEHGESVTVPEGISVYPYNGLLFPFPFIGILIVIAGVIVLLVSD